MNAVGNAVPEMRRVQTQLGRVNASVARATAGVGRYNAQIESTRRSSRRLGYGLGQVGLQVQDVAVQLGMGTSAMRVFSMQGPQILSILGPWGMVAGAVAGVAASLALASGQSSQLTFDFRRFADELGIDLGRVGAFFRRVFDGIKNALATSANFIINGIRAIGVVVGALPEAFEAAFSRIRLRMVAFSRDATAMGYEVRAAMQDIQDALSPSGPEPGFLGDGTAAENLREIASNYRSQAEAANTLARDTVGAVGTISDALRNMTSIDIRDYFSRAAEAVDGEGDGGGPSLTDALTAAQQRMQDISQTMQDSFESGFMSIIDGTASAQDAFRMMAKDIIAQLYRVLVVQRLVGSFDAQSGTGTGIVGSIMGAFGGARANGGPVSSGKSYLVGERGPELFVPSRGGTIVPNGGGGQQVVVNYSFQGGITEADLGRALPVLVERTKREVVDAVQRGGSVARVFR